MKDWPWYLGGSLAVGFLGLLVTRRDSLGAGGPGAVLPIGPPPDREPDPPGAPLRWIELDAPYRLFTDDLYRACVDIPFGVGFLATPAKIVEGAVKMGFRNVVVVQQHPADWPNKGECDRFVEGTWGLEDRIVEGSPRIKAAWRRTRA